MDAGSELVSLSVAPLARQCGEVPRGFENVLEITSKLLEPAYGFGSLLRFKAKFQPKFEPVYLSVASTLDVPIIAATISRAYVSELTLRQSADLIMGLRR